MTKLTAAVNILAAAVAATALVAQTPRGGVEAIFKQPPVVKGPAPKLPDGTPDLSGVWMGGGSNSGDISKGLKPGDSVEMLPWAEKVY